MNEAIEKPMTFRAELCALLNRYSQESRGGDTPDFILAGYLVGSLALFDETVRLRENWYGRPVPMPMPAPSSKPGTLTVPGAAVLTLEQLTAELKMRFGTDYLVTCKEQLCGSSTAELHLDGALRARWKSRLVSVPPCDGITPRGPSEYYDLEFLP